jgi:1-acyl-sn-glycerol-3-phosphate acyltransferase
MGKDAIFRKPFGSIMKWLGGIPIDRSGSNNVVEQSIRMFEENDRLVLTVPPSGTRSRVTCWKTGFYYIADGANVPIALGFLDYRLKIGGIGPSIQTTGDIETDMKVISSFYENITGKYPSNVSEAKVYIPPHDRAAGFSVSLLAFSTHDRQAYGHSRAFSRLRLDIDPAFMFFDDSIYRSHSQAATIKMGGVERLEYML